MSKEERISRLSEMLQNVGELIKEINDSNEQSSYGEDEETNE